MTTTHLSPVDLQRSNEYQFSRKHINGYLDEFIRQAPDLEAMVQQGVELLTSWLSQTFSYQSKQIRLDAVRRMDLEQLTRDIFIGMAYIQTPELYVSVTSQLAGHLRFSDKLEAIKTVAEVCAVLCYTGAFTIWKESLESSMYVKSNFLLPRQISDAISRSRYLPPMVCKPMEITNNFESGYLTHNDCVILGRGNGHSNNIGLDVINTQNQVALKLDLDFLKTVEEEPNKPITSLEQQQNWDQFKYDSYCVYTMMAKQGNHFYLTHKVDKRLRLYAQGYHVTTQGSPFKKASIELANEEIVQGVP